MSVTLSKDDAIAHSRDSGQKTQLVTGVPEGRRMLVSWVRITEDPGRPIRRVDAARITLPLRVEQMGERTQGNVGARYRVEAGRSCIDLKIRHSSQLFDLRDPAPFRERDLDEDAVRYLRAAAQEIPRREPIKIVVSITDEPDPRLTSEVIVEAVRAHFTFERDQLERRLRDHVRRGQVFLLVGLAVLGLCLTLAQLLVVRPSGPVRDIVREGLVITGWVALWRPLEVLLYDWWPLVDERRQLTRLLEAPITIGYPD